LVGKDNPLLILRFGHFQTAEIPRNWLPLKYHQNRISPSLSSITSPPDYHVLPKRPWPGSPPTWLVPRSSSQGTQSSNPPLTTAKPPTPWLSRRTRLPRHGSSHDMGPSTSPTSNRRTTVSTRTECPTDNRELFRETQWARIHLIPLLEAENDRYLV
jgi:hypothetical protein